MKLTVTATFEIEAPTFDLADDKVAQLDQYIDCYTEGPDAEGVRYLKIEIKRETR